MANKLDYDRKNGPVNVLGTADGMVTVSRPFPNGFKITMHHTAAERIATAILIVVETIKERTPNG